jgi:hypothetical protein
MLMINYELRIANYAPERNFCSETEVQGNVCGNHSDNFYQDYSIHLNIIEHKNTLPLKGTSAMSLRAFGLNLHGLNDNCTYHTHHTHHISDSSNKSPLGDLGANVDLGAKNLTNHISDRSSKSPLGDLGANVDLEAKNPASHNSILTIH